MKDIVTRIESKHEVQCFLQNLNYALEHNAKVSFQEVRQVDHYADTPFDDSMFPYKG